MFKLNVRSYILPTTVLGALAASGAVLSAVVIAGIPVPGLSQEPEPTLKEHALAEVPEEIMALNGLAVQPWTGDTEGLIDQNEAQALGSARGEPIEVRLVELTNTGDKDAARLGYMLLDSEPFANARGPVWAVVLAEEPKPMGAPGLPAPEREPDDAVAHYNVWFFNAGTGIMAFALQGMVTQGTLEAAGFEDLAAE